MQDFITEIRTQIPKIKERHIFKILCAMKWRNEKYGKFGLGKRDGVKFGISTRQMTYFIDLLLDYGYIQDVAQTRGSRGFMCRIFKASSVMKDILQSVKQGLNGISKSVGNLSDRIRAFNASHNTFNYLKGQGVVKYNKLIIGDRYIVHKRSLSKYKNHLFDSIERKPVTLFEYLRITDRSTVYEKALHLKLIG